jgi:hypothetical protein
MYPHIRDTELYKAMLQTILFIASRYSHSGATLLVDKFAEIMGMERPSHFMQGLSSLTTLAWGQFLALVVSNQIRVEAFDVLFTERAIKEFYNVYNIEE